MKSASCILSPLARRFLFYRDSHCSQIPSVLPDKEMEPHTLIKDMARGYVEHARLSMFDIAMLLGYTEQSAFTRSFRRWAGKAPSQYRRVRSSSRRSFASGFRCAGSRTARASGWR
ncbi:helix-turn-helix domain-containing protein [Noviherbaspirillum sp. UKPF54]|uniref:helix-turn-helix domain-containing protein n=1 Tax=Noviherbaspirillum sp. UKPF54 TaxID=2601898 RepID=UPI0011B104F4|nr:helix-turn-helix domain-containing protein [Noviherbaspirillum sp. UKPF54]